MYLSIIIPLYNEEETISQVVGRISKLTFPSFLSDFEIVIVDDSSKDDSYNQAKILSEKHNNTKVIRHEQNQGKGAAVKTGLKHITGDVVLIQDADLELSPEDIPQMLIAMDKIGVEFINGSRYLAGISRPLASYKRYLANKFFTFLTSVLINVKLTDMACGYKLIKKSLLDKITLQENRFGFEAELLLKALRIKKNNIAEVPVNYFPRNEGEGKKLHNTDAFKILFTIFKYGWFGKTKN